LAVPVWAKKRLGQVWHGAEACHRSETPKARANWLITGTWSGVK
jgi:hypothetical protein